MTVRKPHGSGLAAVASHAGVSMMTVSRALRDPQRIAPATLARIRTVIAEIGYVPNLAARSLVSNSSRIVAAVVPAISNAMFAETLHGMSDVLRREGLFLTVAHSGYSRREEHEVLTALLGQRPCGIFLHNTLHLPRTVELLRRQAAPVFETGDLVARPVDSVVGYSNLEAGRAMTRHLLARGYRRIAFASAPRRNNERVQQRRRGFHAALREAGIAPDPALEFEGPPDHVVGARLMRAVLAARPSVDAAFFAGERLAIGAYFECQRLGVAVPGRIAIGGFDFYEMNGQVFPSGITTIVTPRLQIGRLAALRLIERIRDPSLGPSRHDLGFRLAQRGTT
jgi:LacI family gluconate utilization system Gnt-I transcriptional repressor